MSSGFAAGLIKYMKNGKGEMILLIFSNVILIFCTILFYQFIIKNNVYDVKSVVAESADGSITIYITGSINWKNIIMYLLFIITANLVIISIIKIIEYKNILNISLKYKIIIIIAFDVISLILLFPSLIGALIFNIMKHYKGIK
jgi:hypothetical protein